MQDKKSPLWIVVAVFGVFLLSGALYLIARPFLPKGPPPIGTVGTPQELPDEVKAMADRINFHRVQAGLERAELDVDLSNRCQKHVEYLVKNRARLGPISLAYHTENPEFPGYSEEGLAAANSSVIAFNQSPEGAVDAWIATLYHRLPLMRPNLRMVGAAVGGGILVMDAMTGYTGDDEKEVVYPSEGQANVPLKFQKEMPDPIPGGGSAGYPITAIFPESWECADLQGSMSDSTGKPIPVYSSCPDKPAKKGFPQDGTLCLIPQAVLSPGTTYKVKITGKAQGKEYTKEWKFSTKAAAVSSN